MRNINAIFADLQLAALKNPDLAAHLEKIRFYLRDNDQGKILRCIQEGINKFKSNSLFALFPTNADKYANYLLELQKHFIVKSPKNSRKRLINLLSAIQENDEGKVNEAFNTGSGLIINDHNDAGVSPLIAALKMKNVAIINLLLRKGATLDGVVDINAPINDEGDTPLHIACELGLNQLVLELLGKNADVNVKNGQGETPLHHAIEYSQTDIARLLLNRNADPQIQVDAFKKHYNAFLLALQKKEYQIASHMVKLGYQARDSDFHYIKQFINVDYQAALLYKEMKAPLNRHKKEIMHNSKLQEVSLFSDKSLQGAEDYAAVFKNIFFAESDKKRIILSDLMSLHQNENAVLKPLLDALKLAMSGHRNPANEAKNKKPLKAVINADHNTDSLIGGAGAWGAFKQRNTVYVAGARPVESILATFLHEVKHFMDQEIYGNVDKPYKEPQKRHFIAMKEVLRNSLDALPRDTPTNIMLSRSFAAIFTAYPPGKQDAEILVKVPEVIGYLGMDEGYKWLKENTPSLLAFYEHRFNPACREYVARMTGQLSAEKNSQPEQRPTNP